MKAFITYPAYRVINNKAYIYLFGRLENGESFVTINAFKPYFYIKTKDAKKAQDLINFQIEDTKLQNLEHEQLSKVIVELQRDIPEVKRVFSNENLVSYESDLRYEMRYLIDKGIRSTINIEGEYEEGEIKKKDEEIINKKAFFVDRVYKEPKIEAVEYTPTNLKVLSYDIETDPKAKKIFCISLYTEDYKKVIIISNNKDLKHAEIVENEETLLKRFVELVRELDPDIITGWNMIDFDFKVIIERMGEYHIKPAFCRDDNLAKLRLETQFHLDSKADFAGRQILDGIQLFKTSFIKLDDYKLNTAAKTILGDTKLLEGESRFDEIERLFTEDQQKLVDYNLKDSKLVFDLLEKAGLIHLTIQRSLLTGLSMERVKGSVASLDAVYLPRLHKKGFIANSSGYSEEGDRIKGGFVMESKPGLYEYILVLDFKSLYPSIMRTFNIDPLSYVPNPEKFSEKEKKDLIKSPNGAYFKNEDGILPEILKELWAQRDLAKKAKNQHASFAIKILMNSFFGVLANPNCRFHSLEMANAITHFGQHLIKLTAEKIEDEGYEVIYGDTDSVFINSKTENYDDASKVGEKLQNHINAFFEKHVTEEYNRKNFMELEFEKVYKMFFMPTVRGTDTGSKKRYAGLKIVDGKEKLDFVGLEAVRGDWTAAAREFQMKMFDLLFHKKEVNKYIKDFVKELKAGKHDKDLIYRKVLTKPLEEYTKTTPPHVKAARKLKHVDSNIIKYVQTTEGPEPIEQIQHKLDYDHYIDKQIKPLADNILSALGKSFDDIIEGHTQKGLGDF